MSLAARYSAFAAVAVTVNLGAQATVFSLYHGPWDLMLGMAVGTGAGLITKYVLDKYWIFYDSAPRALSAHGLQFLFYVLMGVGTTAIFWGLEYAFDRMIGTDAGRLLGGAIGMAIGYPVKYQLDRIFVFEK